MAKFESKIRGNFQDILRYLDREILSGSVSASLEDSSFYTLNGVSIAIRVYERYSWIGGNRLSLNLTLIGYGQETQLTAIASGGSQAVFFKVNTFGEEAFIDKIRDAVARYR